MRGIEELWPVFGLRVRCGPVELRAVRDEDLPALVEVVEDGVHDPATMPFYVPWTDAHADRLPRDFCRYHWRNRAEFSRDRWTLELTVVWEGRPVGCQGISTHDFLVTRTGETGSWLGQCFHGRGIGTLMRQMVCVLCFDHLDFAEVTSSAFTDNPASLRVSHKVGYVPGGDVRMKRRENELAINRRLVLTPDAIVRPTGPVEVEGVPALRELIGLDQASA